jgi:hypothetical protein
VDNAWEQKKPEASLPWRAVQGKILENGGESHLPKRSEGAHVVLGALIRFKVQLLSVTYMIFQSRTSLYRREQNSSRVNNMACSQFVSKRLIPLTSLRITLLFSTPVSPKLKCPLAYQSKNVPFVGDILIG